MSTLNDICLDYNDLIDDSLFKYDDPICQIELPTVSEPVKFFDSGLSEESINNMDHLTHGKGDHYMSFENFSRDFIDTPESLARFATELEKEFNTAKENIPYSKDAAKDITEFISYTFDLLKDTTCTEESTKIDKASFVSVIAPESKTGIHGWHLDSFNASKSNCFRVTFEPTGKTPTLFLNYAYYDLDPAIKGQILDEHLITAKRGQASLFLEAYAWHAFPRNFEADRLFIGLEFKCS
ncbi:MAG: hypothetical protein HRU36_05375 [Rickettsiales bacterium]|nr:hypothetical protein [Rickettsiales bacterium]